jgi:chitin disaccharide deacetylase
LFGIDSAELTMSKVHAKYMIVNGDDFGASPGINRGIIEAHQRGILTSASLIVNMPWSEQAASRARDFPALSIGLHVNFTNEGGPPIVDLSNADSCRTQLLHQYVRFHEMMGCPPTHLDSHHDVHRRPQLLPHFLDLAGNNGLPLRGHSPIRHFSKFYAQWGGVTHPEHISTESLLRMLRTEILEPLTELACHPGYVDPEFPSIYAGEREIELRTLCDPAIRRGLRDCSLQLISFRNATTVWNKSER